MNIVLLGKGDLSIKVADFLIEKNFNLTIIPDKPEPTWSSSLQGWAIKNNVKFVESGRYQDYDHLEKIDLAISIFYGKIIKKDFIEKCEKIINLHNAPLPKYRGVRPINWALKNNEDYHGVTIHQITEGIDDGPILGKITYHIFPEIEEVEDVYKKSLEYGWILFKDVFSKLDFIYKNSKKQGNDFSYYSNKDINKLGNRIDFKRV